MAKTAKSLQDAFLDYMQKSRGPATVFLTNGVKLSGTITWHDHECVTLTRDGITQLVYKHAVSTVMPAEEFQVYDLIGVDNPGNC